MCCQCVANKKHQCVVMTNFIYTEYFGIIKVLIEQGLYKQKMVGKTGFEPATPWSQTRCSTKLNYFPI